MRRLLPLFIALCFPIPAWSQVPDRRGEIAVADPFYKGVNASAPIPVELHVRNEGGRNGAGLCVISSVLAAGMTQGVPGLETPGHDERSGANKPGKGSLLWKTAKGRAGGYSPDKLAQLLNEVIPGEKWVSYVGTDPKEIEKLTSAGYRVCATMNTGQQYKYKPIHHMINVAHYETNGWACIVDNNDPGMYHWMPAEEYARRANDGGEIWAFAWLRKASPRRIAALLFIAAGLAALALAAFVGTNGREPEWDPYFSPALWSAKLDA